MMNMLPLPEAPWAIWPPMFEAALRDFWTRTGGARPRFIYAGRRQRRALRVFMAWHGFTEIGQGPGRDEFYGCPIFYVDADDHLTLA